METMLTTPSGQTPQSKFNKTATNVNSAGKQQSAKFNSKINLYKAKGSKLFKVSRATFRNPYLNFLRDFRQRNNGLHPVETVRRGAREWKCLSNAMKIRYMEEAHQVPRRREPKRLLDASCCPKVTCPCPRRRRKKSACRPKKRACRPKKRSCKPKRKRRKSRCAKRRKRC